MLMQCGKCGATVDAAAQTCPRCGAPRAKFADGGGRTERENAGPGGSGRRRPLGRYTRAGIVVTVIAVALVALAYYSKYSHLENVRRKCIATFELAHRCDCLVNEISKNTYAISFLPMLRAISGLSKQRLGDIIKEAAMTCVEPR